MATYPTMTARPLFGKRDPFAGPVLSLRSTSLGRVSVAAPERRLIDASMMWPPPCGDTSLYTVNYSPSPGSHSILIEAAGDRLGHEATADSGGGRCEGCRCMKKAIERFPDQADLIGRLVEQSETFRSLCEDHQLAVETLDTLTAKRPTDDKIVHEYRTLIEDLEVDIATALNKVR